MSGQRQWGSDRLFINGGNATFTIPSCIQDGQYLLRVEDIGMHPIRYCRDAVSDKKTLALQSATAYPGAQFFVRGSALSRPQEFG